MTLQCHLLYHQVRGVSRAAGPLLWPGREAQGTPRPKATTSQGPADSVPWEGLLLNPLQTTQGRKRTAWLGLAALSSDPAAGTAMPWQELGHLSEVRPALLLVCWTAWHVSARPQWDRSTSPRTSRSLLPSMSPLDALQQAAAHLRPGTRRLLGARPAFAQGLLLASGLRASWTPGLWAEGG